MEEITVILDYDRCMVIIASNGKTTTAEVEPDKMDRYHESISLISREVFSNSGCKVYMVNMFKYMLISSMMGIN